MKYISVSRALGYVVPAPAVHAVLGPFVEYTSLVPAFYAAPAPVVVYTSSAPVVYAAREGHLLTGGISALSWS